MPFGSKPDISHVLSHARRVRTRRLMKRNRRRARKWENPMDDLPLFKPAQVPQNEVVLGVYGSEDWVNADLLRARHLAGLQTLETQDTWITTSSFKLADWVLEIGAKSFTFFNHQKVLLPADNGNLIVEQAKGKVTVTFTGSPIFVKSWEKYFDTHFKRAENLIEWVYNAHGDTISVPLNYRPAVQAAYPWIKQSLSSYFEEYLNSGANVLILIGPPGTGKTTFIKNLIHQAKSNAKVAYDQKVLEGDDFFAGFIEDDCRFLIMEDADTFLESRQDGNTMMHKFLNVSDGLISAADKKLVFSTNLPNVRDIDSALLREGRCFDVVQFRPLDRNEAKAVLAEVGRNHDDLKDGQEFTLAEIFQSQPSGNKKGRSIGFTS